MRTEQITRREREGIFAVRKFARHRGSRDVLLLLAENHRFAEDCGIVGAAGDEARRLAAIVGYETVLVARDGQLHGPARIEDGKLCSGGS